MYRVEAHEEAVVIARVRAVDEACGVAQAAAVMGDWWNLLVLREVARGRHRFDALVGELAVSRRVLTERLAHLVEHGMLDRTPYQERPARYEYRLTPRGEGFLPVLVGMQDWADRWLLGDGTLTATAPAAGAESDRVRALVGTRVPPVSLPAADGPPRDVLDGPTVLFTYPATGPHPAGWGSIEGTFGCTLENRLFRDRWAEFTSAGLSVRGVSTQRPDEQAAFAAAEKVPFPLLSDVDLALTAALRLPAVRIAQQQRLKRLVLVADRDRVVRHTIFPVTDIPAAVDEALTVGRGL
ncbi:winged helix-turn-helix transcriptional regulator [Asanoa sp. WMMD1127]|uniref:winged helix-turn-helix transcriptional regulator n=1 Tax=Asanoa sp. WMMD1127 TaxID=3016107 RepID=UPI002416CF8F|nr:winged helix-turn-helix transcriptional regulator [Asanoa sp. WMMD1127]MDG4823359.1 winged helix-turn-helix transcriptional regulator [Asanoa sp. WMMD1127]